MRAEDDLALTGKWKNKDKVLEIRRTLSQDSRVSGSHPQIC